MLATSPNQFIVTCQRQMGYIMLLTVMLLCALGVVMLFSIGKFAPLQNGATYGYATKQVVFLGIGAVACITFALVDYRVLLKYAPFALFIAVLLLALCFIPGIGKAAKGSARWLSLGGIGVQPSEFAKLSLILFLAWWMSTKYGCNRSFLWGFAFPALITGLVALPILKSPDIGTTLLLLLVFVCMMFVAGVPTLYLGSMFGVAVSYLLYTAINIPQRWERLVAFMEPEKYALGANWQAFQALIALGSGGLAGLGLGMSRQKMYYLPECHTDFIFPIIGEELGMIMTLSVVAAYLVFAACGCWIAMHAPDNGGFYLGMGITCVITLQAMMNLFVVTSLMPNKGIPLPFVSYGGSNLLFCLIGVGILFNLHRQGVAGGETGSTCVVLPERSSLRM